MAVRICPSAYWTAVLKVLATARTEMARLREAVDPLAL